MTFFAKKAGGKRYQSLTNVLLDIEGTVVEATDGGPIGPGGGGVTTIQDEGMTVENAATTLNFTGAGVTASQTSPGVVEVVVPGGAGVTDAINLAPTPPGAPVFQQNNGGVLEFNVLVAGSGLGLLVNSGVIEIESVVIGNNVGGGAEVYQGNTGANLDFRTIVAGSNVTVTQNADTIEIAAAVGSGGPEPVTDFTIPAVSQVGYDEITLVLPQRAVDQDLSGSPTPLRLSLPAISIPADEGRRLGLVLPGGNPTKDLQVRTLDNFVGPDGAFYTPGIWTFAVVGDITNYTTLNWEAVDGTVAFPTPPGQITSITPDSIVAGALPVNVIITGTGGTLPALLDIIVFFSLSSSDPQFPAAVNAASQPGGPNTPWTIDITILALPSNPPGSQPYTITIVDNSTAQVFAELYQAFGVDFSGTVTPFQPSSNVWICDWNVQDGGAAPGGDLFRFSVGPAGTNAVFTGPDALADALAAAGAAAAIEGQAIVVILPGSYSTPGGGWTIPRNVQVTGFAARRSLVRLLGSVTFANQGNNLPPDNTQSLSHVTIEVDVSDPGGDSFNAFGIFMEPRAGAEIGGTPSGDRTLWDVELLQVGVRAPAPQVAILLSGYRISIRECSFTVLDPAGPATNIGVSVQEGPLRMSDTSVEMTNVDQDALNFGFGPTVNSVEVSDCSIVGHVQFVAPASSAQGREFRFSKFRAGDLRTAINVTNFNLDEISRFVKNEIQCAFSPQITATDSIVAIDNVIDGAPSGFAEISTSGISRVQAQTTQEQTVIARRALTARGGFSRRGISTDVHASGFFTFVGDAQVVRYVLTAETSDATPTVLLNDGQQVDPVPIGNNRLYRVLVTARAAGVPTNSYFAEATFSVARDAGPAVQLVAPILPVSLFNGLPPGVGLSGTLGFGINQEPQFIVTGALATTIRWVARVEVLELQEP
jgi:hypothetical protein